MMTHGRLISQVRVVDRPPSRNASLRVGALFNARISGTSATNASQPHATLGNASARSTPEMIARATRLPRFMRPRILMIRRILTAILALALTILVGLVVVGEGMGHPFHREVGPPPADLPSEEVAFASESGATIHGWLVRGKPDGGAVIIMHGVKDTRLSMVERARILYQGGFTVL